MTTLKIRDLRPGETFRVEALDAGEVARLEELVLAAMLPGIPGDCWIASVNLDVRMSRATGEMPAGSFGSFGPAGTDSTP